MLGVTLPIILIRCLFVYSLKGDSTLQQPWVASTAGTMGLLLLQLALRGGASHVAMVDVNMQRLARAEQLGATRTYRDMQQALADEPLGFNCVIDATGVPAVIEHAFMAAIHTFVASDLGYHSPATYHIRTRVF